MVGLRIPGPIGVEEELLSVTIGDFAPLRRVGLGAPPTSPARLPSQPAAGSLVRRGGRNAWLTSQSETATVRPPAAAAASPAPVAKPAAATPSPHLLGTLSMKYETGHGPAQSGLAAATVSSGKGDLGGISYGAYQFNSAAAAGAVVLRFLAAEGAKWASQFAGQDPTQAGAFGTHWKQIAKQEPAAFFLAQHEFIARTHYDPVARYIQRETGLDLSRQPAAIQDAVWSASVQHGNAKRFLVSAVKQADRSPGRSAAGYAHALVNAIYDARVAYVSNLKIPNKPALMDRYRRERADAIWMLSHG